ncbi:MAG TPA: SRPBCC family protein [Myxococcaceae bacterium]|nr:SRPBCC family protein [Myxococcaceae bacterium]
MERVDLVVRRSEGPAFSGLLRALIDRAGGLFAPSGPVEAVTTRVQLPAPPGLVWQALKFYEEVPSRPRPLLRIALPAPVRSEGDKTRVGGTVRCVYEGGHVLKRTTAAEPPGLLRFEVVEQRLGLERCLSLSDGVYEIRATAGGSEVALTTRYRGHLRPRWLFRPFERRLAHQIHGHILAGMRTALAEAERSPEVKTG